jgi:flagellar basal body rod protein FlgG
MVHAEVPGYKKSSAIIKGFPVELSAAQQKYRAVKPQVEGSYYSDIQGGLVKTGNPLDIALGSEGYFVLAGPWGEGYTRDGRFQLDKDGRLVSVAGNFPVMGSAGPIVVTPGAAVEIDQDGQVLVDKVKVDRLRVAQPEQKDGLDQLSGSLFKKRQENIVIREVDSPRVIQGYVEASNVNIVDQMMEMIMMERQYSLNAKIVSTRDGNLSRAMELGRATQ